MRKLWEVASAYADAVDALKLLARIAYECSGDDGGVAPCPEMGLPDGIPPVEGWPEMVMLSERADLALLALGSMPDGIAAAIKAEAEHDDQFESPEALGLRP